MHTICKTFPPTRILMNESNDSKFFESFFFLYLIIVHTYSWECKQRILSTWQRQPVHWRVCDYFSLRETAAKIRMKFSRCLGHNICLYVIILFIVPAICRQNPSVRREIPVGKSPMSSFFTTSPTMTYPYHTIEMSPPKISSSRHVHSKIKCIHMRFNCFDPPTSNCTNRSAAWTIFLGLVCVNQCGSFGWSSCIICIYF